MSLSDIYCNLILTDEVFNEKPLYMCDYCGIKLALDDPDTKVTCFKRQEDIFNMIKLANTKGKEGFNPIHLGPNENMEDLMINKIKQDLINKNEKEKDNLCSSDEINERMAICKTCEYFENNSCLLCGCTVIREANHQNKLAHKDQSCPANKWGPIS